LKVSGKALAEPTREDKRDELREKEALLKRLVLKGKRGWRGGESFLNKAD